MIQNNSLYTTLRQGFRSALKVTLKIISLEIVIVLSIIPLTVYFMGCAALSLWSAVKHAGETRLMAPIEG